MTFYMKIAIWYLRKLTVEQRDLRLMFLGRRKAIRQDRLMRYKQI